MYSLKCEICGFEYEHKKEPYCIRGMIEHLRSVHSISKYDYTVKYLRNGIRPTCACGCGNFVKMEKGWNKFCKYYSCGHVVYTEERKKQNAKTTQERYDSEKYIFGTYGKENILQAFSDFKSHSKTLMDLETELHIDKRTLKRAWLRLHLTTKKEIALITEYNKTIRSPKSREDACKEIELAYEELFEILRTNPKEFTPQTLMEFYNSLHEGKELIHTPRVMVKHLNRIYGEIVYDYLISGIHSKEEIDFYKTLCYFYGPARVKLGKSLQYGKIKNESYNYDICIDDFLLIEYDGKGCFHSSESAKERDKQKDIFARKNGYKLIRATDVDRKTVEYFKTIDKIIKKHEISRNK
mgnify:CR=1 FL=1